MALEVRLLEASQAFEVSENGNLIVSGEWGACCCRFPVGVPAGAPAPSSALPHPQALLTPLPAGKVYQWNAPNPKLFASRGGLDPVGPMAAFHLAQEDVYKELRLRGYNYGPHFQGILKANLEGGAQGLPTLCLGVQALSKGRTGSDLRPSVQVHVIAPSPKLGGGKAVGGVRGPPAPQGFWAQETWSS